MRNKIIWPCPIRGAIDCGGLGDKKEIMTAKTIWPIEWQINEQNSPGLVFIMKERKDNIGYVIKKISADLVEEIGVNYRRKGRGFLIFKFQSVNF